MRIEDFQRLKVWEKAHRLALGIYEITKNFPAEERFCLTSQIRRSAVSICANIAEGQKKSRKDFRRFLEISQGSLEETKYYLLLSNDLNYCQEDVLEPLFNLSDEVGKMLFGLVKKLNA